jgi:glycosyltransferase involved in cell wall biosynthesis
MRHERHYTLEEARATLPWLAERLERHALRHSAAVITVCESLTRAVRARTPQARVFQVEDPPLVNGADSASADAVRQLRLSLGLAAGPVVLYSGNFERYQGVDLLLDAAARVPEAQFVFMGGEAAEIDELAARARALGAEGRCVFAGKRPPAELPVFLALADMVVSPRRSGVNTPFKVYTYLASGKPLVATRIDTHTQLLDDRLALLVEPEPEALAAGVRAVLADPASARERAARGRALIEREYSEEHFAEKVRQAYDAVAGALSAR